MVLEQGHVQQQACFSLLPFLGLILRQHDNDVDDGDDADGPANETGGDSKDGGVLCFFVSFSHLQDGSICSNLSDFSMMAPSRRSPSSSRSVACLLVYRCWIVTVFLLGMVGEAGAGEGGR